MILYIILALLLGWVLGQVTAVIIGARLRKQAIERAQTGGYADINPLDDPEIIDALERQIAKWKAAAHE